MFNQTFHLNSWPSKKKAEMRKCQGWHLPAHEERPTQSDNKDSWKGKAHFGDLGDKSPEISASSAPAESPHSVFDVGIFIPVTLQPMSEPVWVDCEHEEITLLLLLLVLKQISGPFQVQKIQINIWLPLRKPS